MSEMIASAGEIKRFFDYDSMADFRADWVKLTEEEKDFFKKGVGEVLKKTKENNSL